MTCRNLKETSKTAKYIAEEQNRSNGGRGSRKNNDHQTLVGEGIWCGIWENTKEGNTLATQVLSQLGKKPANCIEHRNEQATSTLS